MNPELERRLKRYGKTIDAAADIAAQRLPSSPDPSTPPLAQLDNVVVLAQRRPHRFYRALAVAAAAVAVIAGGVAIAVTRSSPSTSVGDRPLASTSPAVIVDSDAATTEAPDIAPRPTSALVPTTTSATASPPPPQTNATMPRVCSSYTVHNDYHLEICDEGAAVRLVQERLRATIDSSLNVDGYFGPGTRNAVRSFQQMHGLTVDGQVGPATWALLVPDAPGTDTNGNRIVDPNEISTG